MPAFDGATAVSRLDWKFNDGTEGVVPEPSTEQVGAFFDQLHLILDRPEDEKVEDVVNYMAQLSAAQMQLVDEKLLAAYASLCSDQPSAAQLRAVPHRERQVFFGWITGQVVNPT